MNNMRNVVIVGAKRTPIGAFGGCFKNVSAVELGAAAAKAAIEQAGIDPSIIEEAFIGNVLGAGLGQNVGRQVAMAAGIPKEVPGMAINKVCGSGLRAVSLAAQCIMTGDSDVILCGGTENMSLSPYVIPSMRFGARMGHKEAIDTMIIDGLTDAYNDYHMGITAENIAEQWNITREDQDAFALLSQNNAEKAQLEGKFKDEITPITVKNRKGDIIVSKDEYPKHGTTKESLAKLRPAFKRESGTVTAGNASGINDGAAMFIVMSEEKATKLGITPLCTIRGWGSEGVDPSIMGIGPVPASNKAFKRAGWKVEDIELAELNEAFASQSIAVVRDLGINQSIVNVNGGAIALGHPIGASGARILITLIYEMQKRDAKKGLASLCIGGGMGTSLLVERD